MPENWSDYLEDYYQDTQTDSLETSIERTTLESGFTLTLEQPGERELSLQELYAACADSIVGIRAYPEGEEGYYWGTGVIADASGLIVTNAHVIEGCASAVGAVVYFVCVVLMKSITREDCLLLPKGEKIAKLLRL